MITCCTDDVIRANRIIGGIHSSLFSTAFKQFARLSNRILVKWVICPDKNNKTGIFATPSATCSLERAHTCTGMTVKKDSVETAHVDTEFESVGTPDTTNVTVPKVVFDGCAALIGEG